MTLFILALALNYLHKQAKPIVHLDIKSANVLLDAYLRAKVADLGLAKVMEPVSPYGQITPTTSEDGDLDKVSTF